MGKHRTKYRTGLLPPRDPPHKPQPPTPTERALILPEILSHIFLCALPDRDPITTQTAWDPAPNRRGLAALARCCRVSKLWRAEALPRLWSRPCSTWLDLSEVLARTAPGPRRRHHAALIEEGVVACRWGRDRERAEAVLWGLEFPRLARVTVLQGSLVSIPKFDGASVTRLDLRLAAWGEQYTFHDPGDRDELVYVLDQELILGQIPERFPNLEAVEFQDQCLVFAEDLRRLRDRLPRLEHLDDDLVVQDVTNMREAPWYRRVCYTPPEGALARMFGGLFGD